MNTSNQVARELTVQMCRAIACSTKRLVIGLVLSVLIGEVPSPAVAQRVTTIFSFNAWDGYGPNGDLIQATDGNLYGTTYTDGHQDGWGFGNIFRIGTKGGFKSIYTFNAHRPYGSCPFGAITQANDGLFYGVTWSGGAYGTGTVFRLTPAGSLTTLHSFGPSPDGQYPVGGLVQATDGYLYGTTAWGGMFGGGTVFRTDLEGNLTILYSFTGGTDGWQPRARLLQASDGLLYGTTCGDGGPQGYGTIYRISTDGVLTVLYNFEAGLDGAAPVSGLIQASDGNLYGTTNGGLSPTYGTVYRITPTGQFSTLHAFTGSVTGGAIADSDLIQANDGNLYSTTIGGGAYGCGTIFQITLAGAFTVLYSIEGSPYTGGPVYGLVKASDGNIYGTTFLRGQFGDGSIFRMTMPAHVLAIAIKPNPIIGSQSALGKVWLTTSASDPVTVSLSYGNPAVSGPSSVVVPAGETTAAFAISTRPTAFEEICPVTAAYAGTSKQVEVVVKSSH